MRVVYFLPKFNFFTEGLRGRTSHAHGFLSGLKANRINFLMVSGPGYGELYDATGVDNLVLMPRLISRVNMLWVAYSAIRLIRDRKINVNDSVLVIRYATSISYLTSFLIGLFWKGKSIYEINSIGYHQIKSNSAYVLNAVLAIEKRLIAALDFALCVSENICRDLDSKDIQCFVVPNGSSLPAVQLRDIERTCPRFIYLGGFQPYYDFRQLFHCFLNAKIAIAELHVYGKVDMYMAEFPEFASCQSIRFMGSYDLTQLLSNDRLSRSDIFVLPNGRNKMARIGSPTKLFEYLSFGSRIVYQDYGQASDILGSMASAFPYHDDISLTRTLEFLAKQFYNEFCSPVTESEYRATYTWEARVRSFRDYMAEKA